MIFDPRSVAAVAEEVFPGKGSELANLWRTRQFEYAWLRALSGRYKDFWTITGNALDFALQSLKLEPTPAMRSKLMNAYLTLRPWPDAAAGLGLLAESGVKLAFLSNLSPNMLTALLDASGLGPRFEHLLSTDRVKSYKPDPRAYQIGLDAFGTRREETVFAAFGGWDAAGAKWFGYPTVWVNRSGQPPEGLGVAPDATGRDMAALVEFVRS